MKFHSISYAKQKYFNIFHLEKNNNNEKVENVRNFPTKRLWLPHQICGIDERNVIDLL